MKLVLPLALAAAVAMTAPLASSQLASIVGPQVAPVGCPVSISISNDTATQVFTGVCPYQVRNSHGIVIYTPICIAIVVGIDPGKTFSTSWPQIDDNGVQVPAGNYTVDVALPMGGGIQHFPVTIGGAVSSVAPLGVPKVGTARNWQLCAPADGGQLYLMAASGSSTTGIPTCGGTIPLDPDAIFNASLSDPSVFINTFGNLNGAGMTSAPMVAIPNLPSLVGVNVSFAMLVLDLVGPCPFKSISAPMKITIS